MRAPLRIGGRQGDAKMDDDLLGSDLTPFQKARIALARARVAPPDVRLIRARHAHWFGVVALRDALRTRSRVNILRAAHTLDEVYCALATCEGVDVLQEVFGKEDDDAHDKE